MINILLIELKFSPHRAKKLSATRVNKQLSVDLYVGL